MSVHKNKVTGIQMENTEDRIGISRETCTG